MKKPVLLVALAALVAAWAAAPAGVAAEEGSQDLAAKVGEPITAETFRPALTEEPEFFGEPEYFCLVFGEPDNQVWGVFDQSKMGLHTYLYLDRNADGDLTDEGEQIEQPRSESGPRSRPDFVRFPPIELQLPEADGPVPLTVYRFGDALYCFTRRDGQLAVTRPGEASQTVELGSSLEDAPVYHFNGPLTFRPSRPFQPSPGQETELYVELGTPCEIGNTFVAVGYTCLPDDVTPQGTLTYTNSAGEEVSVDFSLASRC